MKNERNIFQQTTLDYIKLIQANNISKENVQNFNNYSNNKRKRDGHVERKPSQTNSSKK